MRNRRRSGRSYDRLESVSYCHRRVYYRRSDNENRFDKLDNCGDYFPRIVCFIGSLERLRDFRGETYPFGFRRGFHYRASL